MGEFKNTGASELSTWKVVCRSQEAGLGKMGGLEGKKGSGPPDAGLH